MKKILMFSSVHVWNDTRIYFKEAISLAEKGYQVDFYALDSNAPRQLIPNLTMHYLKPHRRFLRPVLWMKFYKIAKNNRAEYLHFHDPELLIVNRFLRKTIQPAKRIYDMHEHLPAAIKTKPWIAKKIRKPLAKVVTYIEKKLMKSCDGVIFAEKSYKENYKNLNVIKEDVLNYPKKIDGNITLKKNSVFTMVYVGILIEQRGLWNMLELARILKKTATFRLKLIGPLLDNEASVRKFIEKHALEDQIELYGRISYDEIWNHYYSSDIGLCLLHPTPNNLNSCSTKLFEYMVAGLPTIASDFPQFDEILRKGRCGVTVNPFDIEKISKEVINYYNNPNEKKAHSESALKTSYNWNTQEKNLFNFYCNL